MSTTRKVEGFVNPEHINEPHPFVFQRQELGGCTEIPAVLIIGGKGYTEEDVRAFINDLKDQTMSMAVEQSIDRIAAKHGITL